MFSFYFFFHYCFDLILFFDDCLILGDDESSKDEL